LFNLTKNKQIYLFKIPSFFEIEQKPFNPARYKEEVEAAKKEGHSLSDKVFFHFIPSLSLSLSETSIFIFFFAWLIRLGQKYNPVEKQRESGYRLCIIFFVNS